MLPTEIYVILTGVAVVTLCWLLLRFGKFIARWTLILDSDHVTRAPTTRAVRAPLTSMALEVAGREIVANVVGLGVLVGLTGIVSREALEEAVRGRAPRGTEAINLKALAAGFDAAGQVGGSRAHD